MINVATMESVNPLIILSAMLWNAVYGLACFVRHLTTTTTKDEDVHLMEDD